MGQQSRLSVADSITSFKQLAGDPLTPGSVPYPERGVIGKKKKKMMMMMIDDYDDDCGGGDGGDGGDDVEKFN